MSSAATHRGPSSCRAPHRAALRELLPDRAGRRLRRRDLKTRATRDGDHYVLNGSKAFISGGGVSDIYVCMVRTGEGGPRGISCLVVGRGYTRALLSGRRRRSSAGGCAADLDGELRGTAACRSTNLIGTEGQGFRIAMAGLDGGRLDFAACSIGGAQFCLDRTIEYMRERKQFGTRLAGTSRRWRFASPTTRPSCRPRG